MISTVNFFCMCLIRSAPFSYYVPLLPFLIIIRNDHVLKFGSFPAISSHLSLTVIYSTVLSVNDDQEETLSPLSIMPGPS